MFARGEWGQGYATESLQAMVELARDLGVRRLEAICHVEHRPSAHVIEKCGFELESDPARITPFPNLAPGGKCDVMAYVRTFADG